MTLSVSESTTLTMMESSLLLMEKERWRLKAALSFWSSWMVSWRSLGMRGAGGEGE